MEARGYGTWWNQYGNITIEKCVERAKQCDFVIVKALYNNQLQAFKSAGIKCGVERYVYPTQPGNEAAYLKMGVDSGAKFVVINAEVEWENTDGHEMRLLIETFKTYYPNIEIYASVDTRGNRTNLPYQKVLAEYIIAWMPMIYPKAFQQNSVDSFSVCLDGKNFMGKPVLPTIQTYDNIGAASVVEQMNLVKNRRLEGCQAYTVGHATDDEWNSFISAIPGAIPNPIDTGPSFEQLLKASGIFSQIAVEFSKGNYLLNGTNLREVGKYLLRV